MHLSAPADYSINDHISRDAFSLHYSSVDDAVKLLVSLGRGAGMAKADLKSAVRLLDGTSLQGGLAISWDLLCVMVICSAS